MKGLYPKTGSGLYMFMYTDKGLFLLKGIDHSPRINSFTDLKNSGGIEEWTLTAEEHGDEKGSIGHSSFFEKDEYSKQRDIEKESKKKETIKVVQKNAGSTSYQEPLRYPYLLKEISQVGIVSSIIIIILGITYTII